MSDSDALRRVRVVSFDLDDTLWDCAPAIRRAEAALWGWTARHAPGVLERFDTATIAVERAALLEREPRLVHDVTRLRQGLLERMFLASGHSASLAADAFDEFYRVRSEVELYPEAVAVLDALRQRFRLAAITNGNADLELIGIAGHFDHVFRASVDLPAKPDAAMFEACAAAFDVGADAMLHVGDNVEADVHGAQRAGLQAVWFNPYAEPRPTHVDAPRAVVRRLAELCELLEAPLSSNA